MARLDNIDQLVANNGVGIVTLRITLKSVKRDNVKYWQVTQFFIFHAKDNTGNEIVGKGNATHFDNMSVGQCYDIGEVTMKNGLGNVAYYSGTGNTNILQLNESSVLSRVDDDPHISGKEYAVVKRIADLKSGPAGQYVDVVGVMFPFNIADVKAVGDKLIRNIYIRDETDFIRVALWNDDALRFNLVEGRESVIAIKRAKVEEFEEKKNLSVMWSNPLRIVGPDDPDFAENTRVKELRDWVVNNRLKAN